MKLYVFSSSNLTNIWAGIGAQKWAVSKRQVENVSGIKAKAEKMVVGSLGIFYCKAEFTTPFVVYSVPKDEIVEDVWDDPGWLPFGIHPLGTPKKRLSSEDAKQILPALASSNQPWDHVFHIQPTTAFVPTEISERDWQVFVEKLADVPLV